MSLQKEVFLTKTKNAHRWAIFYRQDGSFFILFF